MPFTATTRRHTRRDVVAVSAALLGLLVGLLAAPTVAGASRTGCAAAREDYLDARVLAAEEDASRADLFLHVAAEVAEGHPGCFAPVELAELQVRLAQLRG